MIAFVYGTRPEAIKIGPVVAELIDAEFPYLVYCTGQHTSLLDANPAKEDLSFAHSLELPSDGSVTRWIVSAQSALEQAFLETRPQLVVVQGDTMSAYAGAAAAKSLGLRLAHIEAGVRSHDPNEPWPEETFRRQIDAMSDLHLAATDAARDNLIRELGSDASVRVTGNTVVSAMDRYWGSKAQTPPCEQYIITLHRREFRKNKEHCRKVIKRLCDEISASGVDFAWPVHPAMDEFVPKTPPPNLFIFNPYDYAVMLDALAYSTGILTDSGGLVEEACTLGIPTVIFRRCNDRPEAITAGTAVQVAPTTEGAHLALQMLTKEELRPRRAPQSVYGTAQSAVAVANALMEAVDDSTGYREERDQADHGVD